MLCFTIQAVVFIVGEGQIYNAMQNNSLGIILKGLLFAK